MHSGHVSRVRIHKMQMDAPVDMDCSEVTLAHAKICMPFYAWLMQWGPVSYPEFLRGTTGATRGLMDFTRERH